MKFLTWKKIVVIVLLSQLSYIPCEINSQGKSHDHGKDISNTIPDFLEKDKSKRSKDNTAKWRSFHKTIYNFSGWGGEPDLISEGEDLSRSSNKDYFYMRIRSKASSASIEKESTALMMTSCQDSAKLYGVEGSYRLFINQVLIDNPPEERRGRIIYNNMARATHYSCKYGPGGNNSLEAKECKGFIKDHGIAVCWPIGENNSWSSCECLTYIKVKGGESSLKAMINYE
ncbi:MAG: hypothetical protein KDK36_12910 [Leptospiraceae bacterium]|nr:hypothetical protein [Leptospiraceae bacterium]